MNSRKLANLAIRRGAVQKSSEFSTLISFLKKRKLSIVVEIGTGKGGTLFAWCRIAQPTATIISIDLPGGPFGGGYSRKEEKVFKENKKKKQRLFLLRKDSRKVETRNRVLKILKGKKIDLLMIDGDHRYLGVKRDFQLFSPIVKKKGLIVFHDIVFHPRVPQCKVHRFWREIKNDFRHVEIIKRGEERGWGEWGGLGVIFFDNP